MKAVTEASFELTVYPSPLRRMTTRTIEPHSLTCCPIATLSNQAGEERISGQVKDNTLTKSVCNDLLEPYRPAQGELYPRYHGAAWENVLRNGITCSFTVRETSFNSKDRGERDVPLECKNISFLATCLDQL